MTPKQATGKDLTGLKYGYGIEVVRRQMPDKACSQCGRKLTRKMWERKLKEFSHSWWVRCTKCGHEWTTHSSLIEEGHRWAVACSECLYQQGFFARRDCLTDQGWKNWEQELRYRGDSQELRA